MPQLIVRQIEEKVVKKLKEQAGQHGVSMEEEHRRILREALLGNAAKRPSFKEALLAMPNVGDSTFSCEQAGKTMGGKMTVTTTPNPSFRRVDAEVFDGEKSDRSIIKLSTIVGRF